MRRREFTGRCTCCGKRAKVRWIERGKRPQMVKACTDCEKRIKNLLQSYRRSTEQIDQGVLFWRHD